MLGVFSRNGKVKCNFFDLYMHPNRPLDLKIVFNQHPKPPNGITNAFCFSAPSGVVNFLLPFRWRLTYDLETTLR